MNNKIKILVADDNKDFANIIREFLSRYEEFEVVGVAYDGNEALKIAFDAKPDVIILDIIMPVIDGIGVMQRLNESNLDKKPEILIFDDSFSALDYKTDKILRETLDEKFGDTTRLIVAQRIGTIKDADLIGFPIRITVGKTIAEGLVEFKTRKDGEMVKISPDEAIKKCQEILSN